MSFTDSAYNNASLWYANLDEYSEKSSILSTYLTEEEQVQAEQFVYEDEQVRYTAFHALLRSILSELFSIQPMEVHIESTEQGMPFLPEHPEYTISLSRSGSWALYGISRRGPIGVDLELLPESKDISLLVERSLSPDEKNVLESLLPEEQKTFFYRLWTRKEALVKSDGTGIICDIKDITVPSEVSIKESYFFKNHTFLDIDLPFSAVGAVVVKQPVFHDIPVKTPTCYKPPI